jgi:sugar-specific transcriptional regulator TrmB
MAKINELKLNKEDLNLLRDINDTNKYNTCDSIQLNEVLTYINKFETKNKRESANLKTAKEHLQDMIKELGGEIKVLDEVIVEGSKEIKDQAINKVIDKINSVEDNKKGKKKSKPAVNKNSKDEVKIVEWKTGNKILVLNDYEDIVEVIEVRENVILFKAVNFEEVLPFYAVKSMLDNNIFCTVADKKKKSLHFSYKMI